MRPLTALPSVLLILISSVVALPDEGLTKTLPDGLQIESISGPVTCDRPTRNNDKIAVNYRGSLQSDGSEFDESYKRGKPFEFTLGAGQVIKGWEEGLLDMCIGQARRLKIPPELGYGDRGAGAAIPPKSTLVFETKLVDIVELSSEPAPAPTTTEEESFSIATAPPTKPEGEAVEDKEGLLEAGPPKHPGKPTDPPPRPARCHLLGPFALLVQGALGGIALLTLVWKRWREVPKRPWKIFFFDVSKQVLGSMLTHAINLTMSMLGSADMVHAAQHVASTGSADSHSGGRRSPNPCSFYLLNLGIDTTIGVPVLWFLLKVLYLIFLRTPLANPPESIKSGHYGNPARVNWYLRQLLIYCIGLVGMKLFVFFLFLTMPWLPWIGDWALRWTEGNEALQITFALFVFPLAMNAVQYWLIDNFIMDKKKGEGEGYQQVAGEEVDDERQRMMEDEEIGEDVHVSGKDSSDHLDGQTLREVEPLPMPTEPKNGEGSRRGSPRDAYS
ncbi:FK506-binding 2 [Lecanosticta acicola]|uniref:peptidylprolyl isomerase n=1 Tax=Lecanosticta acicola TaxID=111012 RepID=A0AAI8YYF1_9PEZI|nr:FK506-binding 2 [Lecanosticta acicola]